MAACVTAFVRSSTRHDFRMCRQCVREAQSLRNPPVKRPSISAWLLAIALFALGYIYFSGDFLKGGVALVLAVMALYADLGPQRKGKSTRKKPLRPKLAETPNTNDTEASRDSKVEAPELAQANFTKIKLIWVGTLLLLTVASYAWPTFGIVFLGSSVFLLGVANNLLSFCSKKLGLFTGSSAAVLALATCAGADLGLIELTVFTIAGAAFGYAFAAVPVGAGKSRQSNDSDDDNRSSGFKAGRGGDFGGGGADGKY